MFKKQKQPIMTIFAGINGAGKSTLYAFKKCLGEPELGVRICPDEILQDFNGDWKSNRDIAKSGSLTVSKIYSCIKNKISFNWETTLVGLLTFQFVEMAKEHGFKIHLNFIGVEKVDLPLARIKERVASGGHGVPEGMVKMRFQHQFLHMDKLLPLLDTAIFYDNTNCMEIAATYYDKSLNIYKPYLSWTNELEHCYENPNPPPKRSAPRKFDGDNFDTVM